MAGQRRNLYLYLALACFLGILLIFVFDGYMGVYDKLTADNGQYRQTFGGEQWDQPEDRGYLSTVNAERGGVIDFTYGINNNRFTRYSNPVRVYLETSSNTTMELLNTDISAGAFGSDEIAWSLDPERWLPVDYPLDTQLRATMTIEHGNFTREITVSMARSSTKEVIIPPPSR
ncbi:MAG: hypothetical protein MUO19_04035 [Dehalococcoidales bacterium]|nr:hypothetical protein [Dehalococcoidales bacterium]